MLTGVAVLTRLPGLVGSRAFNSDEATLAVGGRVLDRGGSLYVDFIDRKPPLPFAFYAMAHRLTGTSDLRPVRAFLLILLVVAALVVAGEANRRWGGRSGWVAGLTLVLAAAALGPQDAPAANFELFAVLPIVVAVVAAARGRAVTAGVALAVAVLVKQPAAVTVVPVVWSLWRHGRWRTVTIGVATSAAAGVLLSWPFGLGRVLHWALLGTGGYLSVGVADLGFAAERAVFLGLLAAGFWCGAWLLVAGAARADAVAVAVASDDRDLWLLLGVSALGVVPGLRFFPHYLLQMVPAVALLAARGAVERPAWVRPALALGVAASLVASALSWHQALTGIPVVERDLSAYAHRATRPGDLIFVWGNEPEIYWRSDRDPAGGFSHTEFLTGYSGGRRPHAASEANVPEARLYRDFLARLRNDPPALVLDTAIAGQRGGRWYPLERFPSLVALLHQRYDRAATIDHVVVYRRKGLDRR